MKFKTSFILLVLGAAPYAKAQTTEAAQCTNTSFQWAFNSRNQSPCTVAGYLGGVCNAGQFTLPQLTQPGQYYQGPTIETANPCRCNTVFYSLLSACAACQDRLYLKWSPFSTNCSTVYPRLFPKDIPGGTSVPSWAYLDVTSSDSWSESQAHNSPQQPESTGATKPTGSTPSALASPSSSESSQSASGSKTNAGAIAGGVVGGVVFLAIIAGIALWLYRRRRDQHEYGTSDYVDSSFNVNTSHLPPASMSPASDQTRFGSPEMGQKLPYYNPSDPNTFPDAIARMQSPTNTYTSHAHSNSIESAYAGTRNTINHSYSTPTHHRSYSGAAEI